MVIFVQSLHAAGFDTKIFFPGEAKSPFQTGCEEI